MSYPITSSQRRKLKSMAQRMDATIKIGKNGLSEGFLKELNEALDRLELVKVRFVEFKDQKKELAPQIAELTQSDLIARVGHVAVYYRQQADVSKRRIEV